jgi:hypothetical protein
MKFAKWQIVPLTIFLLVDGILYVAYTSDS